MPHHVFNAPRKRHGGFTLIELLITVAIAAILSMIAVPSYRDYIVRSNIPDATSNLSTKQVRMEQSFQDNRTYVGGTGCTADSTSSKYFDFTCTDGGDAVAATTYILTAVGKNSMAGFKFTINQTGAKTTRAVPTGWSQPSPNNCWVTKKAGTC